MKITVEVTSEELGEMNNMTGQDLTESIIMDLNDNQDGFEYVGFNIEVNVVD